MQDREASSLALFCPPTRTQATIAKKRKTAWSRWLPETATPAQADPKSFDRRDLPESAMNPRYGE